MHQDPGQEVFILETRPVWLECNKSNVKNWGEFILNATGNIEGF